MSLYTLDLANHFPPLSMPAGLRISECEDIPLLASMGNTSVIEVTRRLANDHVAFIAYYHDVPAAFGWMARGKATIGELAHDLVLPVGSRYLWNFRTMEAFRGLGIYPALLRYILHYEKRRADRYWIIHAPENTASLKGIRKAGFHFVGTLYSNGTSVLIENSPASREEHDLLGEMGIEISPEAPVSCWNCSSPYLRKRKADCCCEAASSECIGNNLPALVSWQFAGN